MEEREGGGGRDEGKERGGRERGEGGRERRERTRGWRGRDTVFSYSLTGEPVAGEEEGRDVLPLLIVGAISSGHRISTGMLQPLK